MTTRWCTVCAAETVLDLVPCADGHGADCPELVCVECGYVVVVGAVVEADPEAAGPGRAATAA